MKRLAPVISMLAPECRHDGATGRERRKGEGESKKGAEGRKCRCEEENMKEGKAARRKGEVQG